MSIVPRELSQRAAQAARVFGPVALALALAGCAGEAPDTGCQLDEEGMQALERAGEGYLRDLQMLAEAVSAPPPPSPSSPRAWRRRVEGVVRELWWSRARPA